MAGNRRAFGLVAAFLALNLVVKFALICLNQAEYTDGILQLTVFQNRAGLYPPLYGALAWLLEHAGLDLTVAGRVVSILAGSLAVIPIYLMARMVYGDNAARFAALFYTIAPLALRWSARVMTDALFLCLVSFSLWLMMMAWARIRREDRMRGADGLLALGSLFAALAALTRYQGAFLAVPLMVVAGCFVLRQRRVPWLLLTTSVAWAALPLWMHFAGFVHGGQFASRTGKTAFDTVLAYLNALESFVLIAPYYFCYPVALFALVGLFRARVLPGMGAAFAVPWLLWAIVILAVQSAFGSFQYRYMLPLFPAVLVMAGGGCAWAEQALASRGRLRWFSLLLGASVVYMALFSMALLVFQRQAFGDQKAAAEYVRANVPPAVTVVSNEQYGAFTELGCPKMTFWSGRRVEPLAKYLQPSMLGIGEVSIPAGTVLVLSTAYLGDAGFEALRGYLTSRYHIRVVASFDSMVVPLHDDIMETPGTSQNPIGWVYRYTPQSFSTQVLVAERSRTTQAGDPATSATSGGMTR